MTEKLAHSHHQRFLNFKLNGSSFVTRFLALLVSIAACLVLVEIAPQLPFTSAVRSNQQEQHAHAEAIWKTLTSSVANKIIWKPCYDGKYCARLMVPLDYADPSGPQAGIALVKVAATAQESRGPVLINPGGPGGSGALLVALAGGLVQKLLGPEYDIIGFDPRGVGRTTPQVVVFTDQAEGAAWSVKTQAEPLANSTLDALSRIRSRSLIYNSLAAARTQHASPYVGTAAVARDMLSITQALGHDKLQYWGFSYGSVIGATYSAMFPDKVGRILIDGIVDAYDYYSARFSTNLLNTDAVLHRFCEACVDAGPEKCALYKPTAEQVLNRINVLFDSLKRRPIAVPINSTSPDADAAYGLVDYKIARSIVFDFLGTPYDSLFSGALSASSLASALAAAESDDGLPLFRLWNEDRFTCACTPDGPTPNREDLESVATAIACGDGDVVEDSVEDLQVVFDELAKTSSFADIWPMRARCVGWKMRAKERFTGPFVGNTSHPILLIGNTADPVTPLANAHTMSKGFKDAVVLTQNSAGHTSMAANSPCTLNYIREYFREGTLPKNGTVCEVVNNMFDTEDVQLNDESLTLDEQNMLYTWRELRKVFKPPRFM